MSDSLEPRTDRRPRLRGPVLVGAAVALLLAVVLVWFQPQKLFLDDKVNEAAPSAASGASPAPSAGPTGTSRPPDLSQSGPLELARGMFVPLDHATSGTVRVLETAEDARVVRLEDFETENGPDLFVYLTASRTEGDQGAFDDEFINLGRLKGNQGDQNYELPTAADLSRFRTVVIWCDRFNSPFGAADLSQV